MRQTAFMLAGLMACTACTPRDGGGSGAARTVKLAFVTNNASEFWKIAAAGVRKYEAEGRVQVDVKMPPNGTPEEQNQILENLASQGYDAIAVSAVAPNDQVPVLNRVAAKTHAHHVRFGRAAIESPALHRHQQLRSRPRARRRRSSSCCHRAGTWPCSSARFSADNAAQRFKGIQDAIAGHKIDGRRPPRGRHRSREGALERRGHRQRASRSQPRRGPLVVQRSGDRRGARVARQEGQGAGGGVRRGGGHAATPSPSGTIAVHRRAEAVPVRLPREQVDARPRHQGRRGACRHSRRQGDRHRRRGHHQGQRGRVLEAARRRSSSRPRARHEPRARAAAAARDARDHQAVPRGHRAAGRVAVAPRRARCWR